MTRSRIIVLTTVLGLALTGCSTSGTEPDPDGTSKPPTELVILRLPANAPPLFEDSVSFYARVDRDDEGFIYFKNSSGGQGEKFARLRIRKQTLLARPDGTPFGPNDSVLIVMKVTDPTQLLIEMQPAGLKFSSNEPAELKIEYTATGGDLDHDGDSNDGDDDRIEQKIAIWRQETLADPFVKLGTVKTDGLRELKAELVGFTRFAIAY